MSQALLVLADGSEFAGDAFGAAADAVFELVFNTSMTGYQEILTDPSYHGQAVLFTVPHIGNVGVNREDYESEKPQVEACVVRALSPVVSSWRSETPLANWLAGNGIPGISGVDTRFLTRKLRDGGTQNAALSTCGTSAARLLERVRAWPGLDGRDMVKEVCCGERWQWDGDAGSKWIEPPQGCGNRLAGKHIVAFDYGSKRNILRFLACEGAKVTVLPAGASARQALELKPDGIFLSNGPGDPAGLPHIVREVRTIIDSDVPTLGICLGHQLIGLALKGRTLRLKFGHHGGNHPVQDLRTRGVWITAQNHNFIVDIESLPKRRVEITHISLNDESLEGIRLTDKPVFSVQFHPEAGPGPHDAAPVFREFFDLILKGGW